MVFIFIKSVFTAIISFERLLTSQNTKRISLNNKPILIDLNTIELNYYSCLISLERCNENCNTLNDSSSKICIQKKADLNVKVFNIIMEKKSKRISKRHFMCL